MSFTRGDIPVTVKNGTEGNKILSRSPFEATPITVDFTSVEAGADGLYKVPAGTPIKADGSPLTGYSTAKGVLLYDVYKDDPAGAVLTKGYIDVTKAAASSGITWDSTFIAGLAALCPMYVFENFS